jgi:SAM-dependent methyltransferase
MLRAVSAEQSSAERSVLWGSAPFERIVHQLAPAHHHLVARLSPQPRESWLDVATGTGAIALRAARAGAAVSGLDFAAPLLETAERLARAERLAIRFELGDAERLPFDDEAFDVVSSAFGAIFAPDHEAVARELARVLRPGGRLGVVGWRPDPGWSFLDAFRPPNPPGLARSDDWGREEYVEGLLGDAFVLEFEEGDCPLSGESPEAVWQLVSGGPLGPMKALVESLGSERREELHRAELEHLEQYRGADGVRRPQAYLLVLGTRR